MIDTDFRRYDEKNGASLFLVRQYYEIIRNFLASLWEEIIHYLHTKLRFDFSPYLRGKVDS